MAGQMHAIHALLAVQRSRRNQTHRTQRNRGNRRLRSHHFDLLGNRAGGELQTIDAGAEVLAREVSLNRRCALRLGFIEKSCHRGRTNFARNLGVPHQPLLRLIAQTIALEKAAVDRIGVDTRRRAVSQNQHRDRIDRNRFQQSLAHRGSIVDIDTLHAHSATRARRNRRVGKSNQVRFAATNINANDHAAHRIARRLTHRFRAFAQKSPTRKDLDRNNARRIAARRQRLDGKHAHARLAFTGVGPRANFLINFDKQLLHRSHRAAEPESGVAVGNHDRLKSFVGAFQSIRHRKRRPHRVQEMDDLAHQHRRIARVVGGERVNGAVETVGKFAEIQLGHARAATTHRLNGAKDSRRRGARPRLEHHHALHSVKQSLQRRFIDGRKQTKAQHGHTTREPEILKHMRQRTLANADGDEAHHLALARTGKARCGIELEPARHPQQVASVGRPRARTQSPLKNELVNVGDNAIGMRKNRLARVEQRRVHHNGHRRNARARKSQRLLDRVAQAREIRWFDDGNARIDGDSARAEHRLVLRIVLENDGQSVLGIAETRARLAQRIDGKNEIGRRNHRHSAAPTAHRRQRKRNRTRAVATNEHLALMARQQFLRRFSLHCARKRGESRRKRRGQCAHRHL